MKSVPGREVVAILLLGFAVWFIVQLVQPSGAFVRLIDTFDPQRTYAEGESDPGYTYDAPADAWLPSLVKR